MMNIANFTIDEMDEFKFLFHEVLYYVKKNIPYEKPVQIQISTQENSIQTTIQVEAPSNKHTYSINPTNALYQIAQHLLKDFSFIENEDQRLVFTLKKEKRVTNG